MIRHLCKLVWNRKRANALTAFQIFISFFDPLYHGLYRRGQRRQLPASSRIFLRK